jgi:PleD family two-component response regulator
MRSFDSTENSTAGAVILAVDDDHHNLFMLQRRLEGNNYRVFTASSGKSALEMAAEHSPDLILLDITMPEMDGFAVKEALNEDDRLSGIPVIFLSDRVQVEFKVRAYGLGGQDFISKPFHPEELLARMQVGLRHHMRARMYENEIANLEETMRTGGVEGADEEEALERLTRAMQMAESRNDPISVLDMKIVGLSELNNAPLARVILMETSEVLHEMVNNATDTVLAYREQGEFLLLAVGTSAKRAQILAEGVKSSIMVRAFADPTAEEQLHVSIGIAAWEPGQDYTPEEILGGAGEAMESAASAGGSRTVVKRLEE